MPGTRRAAPLLAALLLCAVCELSSPPLAVADPSPPTPQTQGGRAFPSRAQVDDARARAVRKAEDVSAISTRLLLADQRLEAADVRAEQASEAYNGAMWRLQQARVAYRAARRVADRARRTVAVQRDRMGALVAQSYQNGGDLSALTAMVGAKGADGVLDQYAAFQGASTSLQADYQRYAATDSLAGVFESQARAARARQERMAAAARAAQSAAAAAAQAAQGEASAVAAEKTTLLGQLARAQHISVALAGQREAALAQIARRRAEQRARRAALEAAQEKAAREKAAREKAAQGKAAQGKAGHAEARRRHDGGKRAVGAGHAPSSHSPGSSPAPAAAPAPTVAPTASPAPAAAPRPTRDPVPGPTPAPVPAPTPAGGAQQAIRFAEAQLGEPYQWGAAGPGSWDCSGLTMGAWGSAGVSLPHYSVAQYSSGVPISVTDLQPGDLVFWSSNGRPSGIHHVALYIGGGQIIHAPRTGRPVEIDDLYYWIPPTFFVRV